MISLDELLPTPDGARAIDAPDPGRGPEDAVLNQRLRNRLREGMRAMPAAWRLVLVLRDVEGLSTREVAQVVGTSEANVKQRLHRARLFMRRHLEERP